MAVLPFTAGTDPDAMLIAGGLTEDITAGLSRFPYLSVVAHDTTKQVTGVCPGARQLGEQLGARGVRRTARGLDRWQRAERPYLWGRVGLYVEDPEAYFENVSVTTTDVELAPGGGVVQPPPGKRGKKQ